jgi:hypothetical protein
MTNSDTKENKGQDDQNFQNPDKGNKGQQKAASTSAHPITDNAEPDYPSDLSTDETHSPNNSGNLDHEPGSASKDITGKDTQEDLGDNDPSEGYETDMDTQKSDEAENDPFETIEADQDNPVHKEFEIGQLGQEELKEDEITRNETGNSAPGNTKPSQRKF